MLQRNDTNYTQHVSAWPTEEYPDHWPFSVGPGEIKDFPKLLAGFTLVEGVEPEIEEPLPEEVPEEETPAPLAADEEEGEQE